MTMASPSRAPHVSERFENTARFDADPRADKVLLQTGLYVDDDGQCGALSAVTQARQRVAATTLPPYYTHIEGYRPYRDAIAHFICGPQATTTTLQTLGGTGALRILGEVMATLGPDQTAWLPSSTWPNHYRILGNAGVRCRAYPWDTQGQTKVDVPSLIDFLRDRARPGDAMLLHVSCHNPSGIDLTPEQWRALGAACLETGVIPIFDAAFLGYRDPPKAELAPVRAMAAMVPLSAWTISLGKTLRVYNSRLGALIFQGTAEVTSRLLGHAAHRVRGLWSSPPVPEAAMATMLLTDADLISSWQSDLATVRARLRSLRAQFVREMNRAGVERDFSHVLRESGLFTQTGLTPPDTVYLRDHHAIYMGTSGGINLAPLGASHMARFCHAAAPLYAAHGED